jgi:hypothetical protein
LNDVKFADEFGLYIHVLQKSKNAFKKVGEADQQP